MYSKRTISRRFLHLLRRMEHGLILALAALLSCTSGGESRPGGTLADVISLHERNDLNVLFILIDTLRSDRLNAYGYELDTSPNIHQLAESGIRFQNHLSQSSWTKCSMASLWTGLYPNRSGVLRSRHAVPEAAILPAEILREEGFRTAGIFRNGWVAPNFGFAQGFEIYMMPTTPSSLVSEVSNDPAKIAGSDSDVIRAATGFLRTHAKDRWFLYVHLLDVHQFSSDEPSSVFGTSFSNIYDNAILWTDKLIGHLLAELDKQGIRDRTLIILASDHGEAFGEHGNDGHAYDVYGEVTEVPFIVSLPFRLEPGVVVESPSENVDIWPTILDLLGMSGLEEPDGHSLLPAIEAAAREEKNAAETATLIAHLDRTWARESSDPQPHVSVTEGNWRLIYRGADESLELFNKGDDPREQRNVVSDHSEVAKALKKRAEDYLENSETPWPEEALSIEIDEMEMNQLRALGYGVQ